MTRESALHLLSRTPNYRCATLRDNALELREALVAALEREAKLAKAANASRAYFDALLQEWDKNDGTLVDLDNGSTAGIVSSGTLDDLFESARRALTEPT